MNQNMNIEEYTPLVRKRTLTSSLEEHHSIQQNYHVMEESLTSVCHDSMVHVQNHQFTMESPLMETESVQPLDDDAEAMT